MSFHAVSIIGVSFIGVSCLRGVLYLFVFIGVVYYRWCLLNGVAIIRHVSIGMSIIGGLL